MGLTQWLHPKNSSEIAEISPAKAQPAGGSSIPPEAEVYPGFDRAVDDAMCLLLYAAEKGRIVDDPTRSSILHAVTASNAAADETLVSNLLAAYTKVAAQLRPVTADSIRASCGNDTNPTIKSLRMWACILAFPIILFSVLAFVSSSISSTMRADITTANELLVRLRSELGTEQMPSAGSVDSPKLPQGLNEGDVITQLQQYASTVRAIDARALQLNWFVFNAEWDPFQSNRSKGGQSQSEKLANQRVLKAKFELPVGLANMPKALDTLTDTYQDVRSFAQSILDLVTVSYGAITTCLLPVLYALLGTCAYLLRTFEEELKTMTFLPSSRANLARFLIAGIGGAVVGLFSNFTITQGASISPLAIAFLVGYAVDVFFSFLEGLLQAFGKHKVPSAAGASTPTA